MYIMKVSFRQNNSQIISKKYDFYIGEKMSARSQLQSKPVAELRSIAESLSIEHKGLQKAKLIDLLVDHSDEILDGEESEVAEVITKSSNDDGPSVVSSGDSEIKKGDTRDGILDILPEGYGFLRCNGYKPSEDDVYVAAGLIKKFRMRKGDMVSGLSLIHI